MNAMEKVAWTEVIVTMSSVVATAALLPWLGDGAWGAFGLLGLLVVGAFFVRSRDGRVVVDERDREIEQQAMRWGIGAAWQFLFMSLIALVFWSSTYNEGLIPTRLVTWLIWLQFATCYLVKGIASLLAYRRATLAT